MKKWLKVIGVVSLLILAISVGIIAVSVIVYTRHEGTPTQATHVGRLEYESVMRETIDLIYIHTSGAEGVLSQIASTWRWAVDSGRDINVEINRTLGLEPMQNLQNMLRDGNAEIIVNMRELQNPPDEFLAAYDTLLELFDIYTQLHNLALSPSGSLQTFNTTRNDLFIRFDSTLARLDILLP